MVRKIRSRDVATEEDSLNTALRDEGYDELHELSLEEKRQILQAILNSKEQSHHSDVLDATPDVSSTTLEKKSDDNIIVQIEDSCDSLDFVNLTGRADNSSETTALQAYDSFEEVQQDNVGTRKTSPTMLDKDNQSKTDQVQQHRLLMELNILDHPEEPPTIPTISFYEERLKKIRSQHRNKHQNIPWHYDPNNGLTKDEHFDVIFKEMGELASKSVQNQLSGLESHSVLYDDLHRLDQNEPVFVMLPYGLRPKEVPFSQIQVKDNEASPAKEQPSVKSSSSSDSDDDLFKSQLHKTKIMSTPKKIVIKPRVVIDIDDESVDHNKPGPSSKGNFSPINNKHEEHDSTKNVEKTKEVEGDKEHFSSGDDFVDCPLCFGAFKKIEIEEHFELCERSKNTELLDGCCPFCNISLPAESLKEKHMAKCLSKQRSTNAATFLSLGAKRQVEDDDKDIISDSEESELGEGPPVKKMCTES